MARFLLTLTALLFFSAVTSAQEARPKEAVAEERPVRTPEVIVTATRHETALFDAPYTAHLIDGLDLRLRRMARTVPEAFEEEPSVMVQKTGRGQGSPFMRGFTSFRNLMLIDGIRLNNSVFRSGPNQYWATVDPYLIDRLEVVKGPGSVLYGSDAIGGTVNAITRRREHFPEGFNWRRRILYRFATADRSHIGRAEIEGNYGRDLGFLFGTSLKDFNDLRAGGDVGYQDETGYDERNFDARLDYFVGPDHWFTLAHQRYRQFDAWRAHKTIHGVSWHGTTIGDERERSLDQGRELTYLQYHGRNLDSFIDTADLSLSWHEQKEERFRERGGGRTDIQGFKVGTLGLGAQFASDTPLGLFTYGAEYYRDNVDSFARKWRATGAFDGAAIQGPVADNATYDLLGIYLQDEFPITERLEATLGARYTYAKADADSVQDPMSGEKIAVSDDWDSIVGSARLLYHLTETWNLFGGLSQGFRAPNLSDLTRLDSARSNEIETPSPGLDPEDFLSAEIGAKVQTHRLRGQVAYYYTWIRDMIVRFPTGRTVQGLNEVQKANVGDGFVHGIEIDGEVDITDQVALFGGMALQRGEVDTFPTSAKKKEREPISRLAPLTAVLGTRYTEPSDRFWCEALVRMADDQHRLSTRDEGDTQRIPPGGTPGYGVLDLRAGLRVTKDLNISAALENVLDKAYRIHGSGQNEPGRNFVLTVDWLF
jgi:hemoglobin/transferrin/lactoferrin receptor protein